MDIEKRLDALLDQMTLEEMILQTDQYFSHDFTLRGEDGRVEEVDMERLDALLKGGSVGSIQARGMTDMVTSIDFSNTDSPEFDYGGKYTVVLGKHDKVEYKFGMFVTVLGMLKEGDVGVIDVSNGTTAHFSPN